MEQKFKVGDKVRVARHTRYTYYSEIGETGTVKKLYDYSVYDVLVSYSDRHINNQYRDEEQFASIDLELITTNTTNMKEKFALLFKSEPQKSFRKAGITNGDDLLTDEGQKIFLSWLLTKNQDAFKKEVVDLLLEEVK